MREELRLCKEELRITKEENLRLKEENAKLKEIISELRHKKDSNNSSLPPSSDIHRKTKSLRQKSGKKSGGQPGHKGNTLAFNSNPVIIDHIESTCPACGKDYIDEPILKGQRQVLDIPPIVIEAVEHRIYERRCSCGVCKVSSFPEHVKSPISYGQHIGTLCGYLSVRQYMSVSRIKELFESVFKLSISEGTIINKINTLAQRCHKQYEEIRKEIEQSVCVGTDETGSKVNGVLHWI